MITTQELIQAHHDYLKSGQRYNLPSRPFRKKDELRVSDLSRCPIQWSMRKLGIPMTHPETETEHGKLHMFEQGRRVAEIWQEALMWSGLAADIEVPVEGIVPGTVDALLVGGIPVEIKNTEYRVPQEHHYLQLWSYMDALSSDVGFLIFQRRNEQQVFYVEGCNREAVASRVNQFKETFGQIAANGVPPRKLDEAMPNHCVQEKEEKYRPSPRKLGTMTVACPFFANCYPGHMDSFFETHYNERGELEMVRQST